MTYAIFPLIGGAILGMLVLVLVFVEVFSNARIIRHKKYSFMRYLSGVFVCLVVTVFVSPFTIGLLNTYHNEQTEIEASIRKNVAAGNTGYARHLEKQNKEKVAFTWGGYVFGLLISISFGMPRMFNNGWGESLISDLSRDPDNDGK